MVRITRKLKYILAAVVVVVLVAFIYTTYAEGFVKAMTEQQAQEAVADAINSNPTLSKMYSIAFYITLVVIICLILFFTYALFTNTFQDSGSVSSNTLAEMRATRNRANATANLFRQARGNAAVRNNAV